MVEADEAGGRGEVLTTSPTDRTRDAWLQRTIGSTGRNLGQMRDHLFELSQVQRHHLLLVVQAASGLLTWEAVRRTPEGGVWALATGQKAGEALRQQAQRLPELERPTILIGTIDEVDYLLSLRGEGDLHFDRVLARNPFTGSGRWSLRDKEWSALVKNQLLPDGLFCFVQVVPRQGQRLYRLVNWEEAPPGLAGKVEEAEEAIYHDPEDPLVNWDVADLEVTLHEVGFESVQLQVERQTEERRITTGQLARWFEADEVYEGRPGYGRRLHATGLRADEVETVTRLYRRQLEGETVQWESQLVYVVAGR